MIIVTRTYTRPNVNVPFFIGNKATVDAHILNAYQGTANAVLGRSMSISTDRLTLTSTMVFMSQGAREAVAADPIVLAHYTERAAYNNTNGITETVTAVEQ